MNVLCKGLQVLRERHSEGNYKMNLTENLKVHMWGVRGAQTDALLIHLLLTASFDYHYIFLE